MQIQINTKQVALTDPIEQRVTEEVEHAMRHFNHRVTRVEVHLHDLNGPNHSGVDKRCRLEARLAGHQPLAVENDSDDLYEAIHGASGKLERAVRRMLERHDAHLKLNDN